MGDDASDLPTEVTSLCDDYAQFAMSAHRQHGARAERLTALLPELAQCLHAVEARVNGAQGVDRLYVKERLDPACLRSVTLWCGRLPVRTATRGELDSVQGAALHFAESTSHDLVCVVWPFRFGESEPSVQELMDPLSWRREAHLPRLLARFFEVARASHPYGATTDPGSRATAFPGAPEAAPLSQSVVDDIASGDIHV